VFWCMCVQAINDVFFCAYVCKTFMMCVFVHVCAKQNVCLCRRVLVRMCANGSGQFYLQV